MESRAGFRKPASTGRRDCRATLYLVVHIKTRSHFRVLKAKSRAIGAVTATQLLMKTRQRGVLHANGLDSELLCSVHGTSKVHPTTKPRVAGHMFDCIRHGAMWSEATWLKLFKPNQDSGGTSTESGLRRVGTRKATRSG